MNSKTKVLKPDALISYINYLLETINKGDRVPISPDSSQEKLIKLDPKTENVVVVKTRVDGAESIDHKVFVHNNDKTSTLVPILNHINEAGSNYIGAEILTPYYLLYFSKEQIMNNLVLAIKTFTDPNNNVISSSKPKELVELLRNVLVSDEVDESAIKYLIVELPNEDVTQTRSPLKEALAKNSILRTLKQKAIASRAYFVDDAEALAVLQEIIDNDEIKINQSSAEPADIFEAEIQRWRRDSPNAYSTLGFLGIYNHLLAVDSYKDVEFDVEPFNQLMQLIDEPRFSQEEFQEHFRLCTTDGVISVSKNERIQKLFQVINLIADYDIKEWSAELENIVATFDEIYRNTEKESLSELNDHYVRHYDDMKRRINNMQNDISAAYDLKEFALQIGGEIKDKDTKHFFVSKIMYKDKNSDKLLRPSIAFIYNTLLDSYPVSKISVHGIHVTSSDEVEIRVVADKNNSFSLQFDNPTSLITPLQKAFDDMMGDRIAQVIAFKGVENEKNIQSLEYYLRGLLHIDSPNLLPQYADSIVTMLLDTLQLKPVTLATNDQVLEKLQLEYLGGLLKELGSVITAAKMVGMSSVYEFHIQDIIGSRSVKVFPDRRTALVVNLAQDMYAKLNAHRKRIQESDFYAVSLATDIIKKNISKVAATGGIPIFQLNKFLLPIVSHQVEWADPLVASYYQSIVDYNQKVINQFASDVIALAHLNDTPVARKILDDVALFILKSLSEPAEFFQTTGVAADTGAEYEAIKTFFANQENQNKRLSVEQSLLASSSEVLTKMYKEAVVYDYADSNHWVKYANTKLKIPVFSGADICRSSNFIARKANKYLLPNVRIQYINNQPTLLAQQGSINNRNKNAILDNTVRNPLMRAILGENLTKLEMNKYKLYPAQSISPPVIGEPNTAMFFLTGPAIFKVIHQKTQNSLTQKISVLDAVHTLDTLDDTLQYNADRVHLASTDDTNTFLPDIATFIQNTVKQNTRDILFSFNYLHGDYGVDEISSGISEQQLNDGIKYLKIKIGRSGYANNIITKTIYLKDVFELILSELENKVALTSKLGGELLRIRFHFGSCLIGAPSSNYTASVGLLDGFLPNDSFVENAATVLNDVLSSNQSFLKIFKRVNFEVIGAMGVNMSGIIGKSQLLTEIVSVNSVTGKVDEQAQVIVKVENGVVTRQYQRMANPSEYGKAFRESFIPRRSGVTYVPPRVVRPVTAPINIPRPNAMNYAMLRMPAPLALGFRPIHWK